jgi:aspartyl-tRNA(Asn)/glutamyl-tRNA(Gln) amidotransferase subunit B
MELEVIIGLEIHAQLATASKLWCGCDNDAFGADPNTRICPVCCGFPGMLPVLNKEALRFAMRASVALGCEIQLFSKFDRKNYFYPDLPTGYQITQFDNPIALSGKVEIIHDGHHKKIGITRVHLENDAGKLIHEEKGTCIDFNRAGSPLIEIVTEPELRSPAEAKIFAQELQKIIRSVGASDADMEKGMMRFDASISLRPVGEKKLYPRSEIKNLNTFSGLEKALQFEIQRQTALWEKNERPEKETTRGFDESTGKTKLMRQKESADDYRYFPEPDIPPLRFTEKEVEELVGELPELPLEKYMRYKNELGLTEAEALRLSEEPLLSEFFETALVHSKHTRKIANLLLSVVLAHSNWKNTDIEPLHLAEIAQLLEDGKVSSTGGKQIIEALMESGGTVKDLLQSLGLEQVSDNGQLEEWVDTVLEENTSMVAEFHSGKEKVIGALIGQVMKKSGGSANPPVVQQILKERLKK